MRVLLATAVDRASEGQNRYRPLWPAYLAAQSDQDIGSDAVNYRYCQGDPADDIEQFNPDVLCVSSVTQNYNLAIDYARSAKRMGIPVIIGGMHASALPSFLAPEFDVACIGEGELTFVELMKLFLEKRKFTTSRMECIPGLAFRDNGNISITPDRLPISSLDDIPHPRRSLIGYHRRDYMVTARGCAHKCVFCICSRYWGDVRYLSATRVVDEIGELIDNSVKIIRFNDDNFVANRERLRKIAEGVRARNYHNRVRFSCWARADSITPEVVGLLKSMNVVAVVMGLESGSEKTLRYLKGKVSIETNINAIELLKDAGIQASGDFIIGAPGETYEDVEKTYQFIRKNRLDFVNINVFTPLPGTPVWEQAKEKGIVKDNMDWSCLNFKFTKQSNRSIHMSDQFNHQELYRIYNKFKRLSNYRNLKALIGTPWLDEIPSVSIKKVYEGLSALGKRM